jgi:hypothetical protein
MGFCTGHPTYSLFLIQGLSPFDPPHVFGKFGFPLLSKTGHSRALNPHLPNPCVPPLVRAQLTSKRRISPPDGGSVSTGAWGGAPLSAGRPRSRAGGGALAQRQILGKVPPASAPPLQALSSGFELGAEVAPPGAELADPWPLPHAAAGRPPQHVARWQWRSRRPSLCPSLSTGVMEVERRRAAPKNYQKTVEGRKTHRFGR